MPLAAADILFKLSTKAGAAGNTTAGTPAGSLGKYVSTTEITDGSLHNLFDAVSGDENAAEDVEYRCFFVHNSSADSDFVDPVVWLSAEGAGGADIAIGVDTTAASAVGSASAQALEVANESTAPVGVTFSAPTTKGTGLALGTVGFGEVRAIWVRRTATDSAAVDDDSVTISLESN